MPIRIRSLVCVLAAAFLAAPASAQATRDHDIQLEDYFTQAYVTSIAMSPDGSHVAYTEMRWDEQEDGRNTDIWVADVASKRSRRMTFDNAVDADPQWSADGKWIYFMSARTQGEGTQPPYNGKRQVWRIGITGDTIFPVTRLPEGINQYQISGDGRSLYYTIGSEHIADDRWKELKSEFNELHYGHGVVDNSQLWKLDLDSWRSEKVVDDGRVIGTFAVTPDQRRIAMITTPTEELITNEGWSRVDIYDAVTGSITTLNDRLWRAEAPSPYGWIVSPVWTSDGNALAFRVDFDGYPGQIFVARMRDDGDTSIERVVRPGTPGREVAAEGAMAWRPRTNDLCFIAEDHARARVYCIPGAGAGSPGIPETLTPGDVVISALSFSSDAQRLAVVCSDVSNPPDIYVLPASGGSIGPGQRITHINPQVDRWKLPQIQVVKWTSPDGTPVEGILELPHDWTLDDGPLPTVVAIHGGPTASTKLAFQFWIYGRTLFASRGWALFSPNYRGSTGYGDEFLAQLIGNKNNLDVADILSGVDALVERGIADPDRLAVMGWSNGGYLTNCLITSTDRFKAASSGAGVFDTVMQWEIEDTPGHVVNYSKGLPWSNPKRMHDSSPLYDADRITTPTLIHVGENDERVPVEHSIALHRALHHYLNVPTELVIYPGAGHGLTKYTHRKAKLDWDVEWFDYFVLGEQDQE